MTFIERIESRRREIGVSQHRLCIVADINPSTYTRLRQDRTTQPQARTRRKLLQALETIEQREAIR